MRWYSEDSQANTAISYEEMACMKKRQEISKVGNVFQVSDHISVASFE